MLNKQITTEDEYNALDDASKVLTLEGGLYWTCIHTPYVTSPKSKYKKPPMYKVDLALDTEEALQKARNIGLTIKDPSDSIPFPHITVKRNVKDLGNPSASQPEIVDSLQKTIPSSIEIGNGSRGLVKFGTYWHGNPATGATLFKIQVTNLVRFDRGALKDKDLVVDSGGFTVEGAGIPTPPQTSVDEDSFDDDSAGF